MSLTNLDTELSLENMTWSTAPDFARADAPTVQPRAQVGDCPEDSFLHAWATMQLYGLDWMQTADGRYQPIQNRTLPERLAGLLVELGAQQGGVIRHLAHQSLADSLGTQRETIGALLRSLHRQGLIRVGYRRIEVLDAAALAELAW